MGYVHIFLGLVFLLLYRRNAAHATV